MGGGGVMLDRVGMHVGDLCLPWEQTNLIVSVFTGNSSIWSIRASMAPV